MGIGWGWGDWWPWYELDLVARLPLQLLLRRSLCRRLYYRLCRRATPYTAYRPADDGVSVAADGTLTPADQGVGPLVPGPSSSSVREATGDDPFDFHGRARAAFAQGDYRKATYLAAHATVDEPRNPRTHLLYSLGMFALGEYRGAAMEVARGRFARQDARLAHAVRILRQRGALHGPVADIGEVRPRQSVRRRKGRFLLGFHYLMAGHADEAKDELASGPETGAAGSSGGPIAQGSGRDGAARDCQAVVGVAADDDAQTGLARTAGSAAPADGITATPSSFVICPSPFS